MIRGWNTPETTPSSIPVLLFGRQVTGWRFTFLSLKIAQLVELEVCGLQTRATFEPDDPHTGLAELGREDRAGCPDADDHNICLFSCYGSPRF